MPTKKAATLPRWPTHDKNICVMDTLPPDPHPKNTSCLFVPFASEFVTPKERHRSGPRFLVPRFDRVVLHASSQPEARLVSVNQRGTGAIGENDANRHQDQLLRLQTRVDSSKSTSVS